MKRTTNMIVKRHPHTLELSFALGDFGCAKTLKKGTFAIETVDDNSYSLGDSRFSAPEVLEGIHSPDVVVTTKADVFSYGLLLRSLVEGPDNEAFLKYIEARRRVMLGAPNPRQQPALDCSPPEAEEMFGELIFATTQLDPHERPDFAEIIARLEPIIERLR